VAIVGAVLFALGLGVAPVWALSLPTKDRPTPCTGSGRLLTCTVLLPKNVKVRSNKVTVLVPKDYAKRGNGRLYPVVYVLHGVGDDNASWTNPSRGDLAALTASCKAIFVMPDGGSGPLAGWYSDWKDGSYQYETYHTQVVRQAIDRTFRTTNSQSIAGLSMGGFGALSYSARHPGMFKATASYSGFVDTQFGAPISGVTNDVGGQNPVYSLGTPSKRVWGDQTSDAATWAAHNPYALVTKLRGQRLFVSSGHGLLGGSQSDDPTKAANYVTEAYVGHLNDRFATALAANKIAFTDAREQGGRHDWPYWRANFTKSLKVLMPPLRAASKGCGA